MNYTSRQPGSTSGLVLALNVNQQDYFYANSPAAGFRVRRMRLSFQSNKHVHETCSRRLLINFSTHCSQYYHLVSESPPYIQGQFFVPKDTAPQSTMLF